MPATAPPTIRTLSLGAGVQSTTLLLLACEGQLPKPDAVIFADTGWEPRQVYDHLTELKKVAADADIPLHRVSNGNLRRDAIDPAHRYASIPYFVRNPDRSNGMGRRQCTAEYKLVPINCKIRELLGASPPHYRRVPKGRVAEQWIGFSTDEVGRINDRSPGYLQPRYPLLELHMSRADCQRWLTARGWTHVPKSSLHRVPLPQQPTVARTPRRVTPRVGRRRRLRPRHPQRRCPRPAAQRAGVPSRPSGPAHQSRPAHPRPENNRRPTARPTR